jgi:ABC-type phosphate transport system substrate-binding protein
MVRLGIGALLILIVAGVSPAAGQATDSIAVIANRGVPEATADAAEVRRIFLMRQRFWAGGRPIAPVNLPATSAVREDFSRLILGSTPQQLADYWNDLYFHGTQPPPVLRSEAAIVLYVARTPGAVGYVSQHALADAEGRYGVKVLLVVSGASGVVAPGG